jgi:hypothetical protein
VTNLAGYLSNVLPFVCSQGQFDSVYFDLSQAFIEVPYALLLDKLIISDCLHFMLIGPRSYEIDIHSFIF